MVKSYKSAKMHQVTFSSGVGEIKRELSVNGDATHKAVESITINDNPNIVTVVFKDNVGKRVSLDIPLSNFENLRE